MAALGTIAPPMDPSIEEYDPLGPIDLTDVTVQDPMTSVGGSPFSCATCTISISICC